MAKFLFGSIWLQMTYKAKYVSVAFKTFFFFLKKSKQVLLTVDTSLNVQI